MQKRKIEERYLKEDTEVEHEPDIMQLHREVDRALERTVAKNDSPDAGNGNVYENEDPANLVRRIEKCGNEIRSTLSLIATISTEPTQLSQDVRVSDAAKQLLAKELKVLNELVEALINKNE